MQTWSRQNTSRASSPTRKLITTSLLAFSLAGLIIGFAVGGLTVPKPASTASTGPTKKATPVPQTPVTATATPTPPPDIILGLPKFTPDPPLLENADNTTTYTVSMQAIDKQNKPVHSNDIVCKLWLVQQIPDGQKLNIDKTILKAVDNLNTPIQGTVNNQPVPEVAGLTFTPTTQTTHCDANGKATWQYKIASTIPPGQYDLVILSDWKGSHYNWSWINIKIQ